jgi:hypothetical protein
VGGVRPAFSGRRDVQVHGQQESEMPSLTVDLMDNAAPWNAFAPDGVTPSAELSLLIDTSRPRPQSAPQVGRVSGTDDALLHSLRRNLGGLDLTGFDELRLWVYGDRAADGTPANPFVLEMTLGSAALGLDDPANTWVRYLPVSRPGAWEPVRLTLGDLPATIRGAVTRMRLRCVSAARPFQWYVDDILAVREEMIADVDAALVARLHNRLTIGANTVPAVMQPANGALNQTAPFFKITHYDVVYSRERTSTTRPRGDFINDGYSLRPQANAYELYYQITAEADDRPAQSKMLEFALRALPPFGDLSVNGFLLPLESVVVPPFDQVGRLQTDTIPIFYKVSTRQEVGTPELVSGVRAVTIAGDLRA